MPTYLEELPKKQRSSRRRFLRNAAVGAVGAGAVLSFGGENTIQAQSSQAGEINLDAILLNYVCSPENSAGVGRLTLTDTFTNTFRLSLASGAAISLTTSTTINPPGPGPFGGSGSSFMQSVSGQVAAAITTRDTVSYTMNTPAPGQVANTKFYGLLNPKMRLEGSPTVLNFKFVELTGGTFSGTAQDFQSGVFNSLMSQDTINSILATYLPLQDPTGSTLRKPRFKRKGIRNVGSGADAIDFVVSDGSSFSSGKTVTFSAQIRASVGFSDPTVTFELGVSRTINVTLTSVQEVTSEQIATLHFDLINNSGGLKAWRFYRDRVFKNWVIIDETRPIMTSGQATIQGTVRDVDGNPVANAIVAVTQSEVEYSAKTNGSGYYQIATPQGEALTTGYKTVTSGGQSQQVYVNGGAAYAHIYGADPYQAQHPVYHDDYALLN